MSGPRLLYLHGFASGPDSRKGVALAERLAGRASLERLDLRIPSLERLSLAAMLEHTRSAIGGPRERVILLGSSMGGLVAARLAEDEPRVCALVLLAPAFRFAERWHEALGEEGWDRWMRDGWRDVFDHTTGRTTRVHADLAREVERIDVGWADVRVPTLILHGAGDEVVPVDVSRRFVAGRPHVRLVEVDDGHDLAIALPTVLDEIERFLAPVLGSTP